MFTDCREESFFSKPFIFETTPVPFDKRLNSPHRARVPQRRAVSRLVPRQQGRNAPRHLTAQLRVQTAALHDPQYTRGFGFVESSVKSVT